MPVHMTRDCMWQHCCLSSPATGDPGFPLNGILLVMDGNGANFEQIILAWPELFGKAIKKVCKSG